MDGTAQIKAARGSDCTSKQVHECSAGVPRDSQMLSEMIWMLSSFGLASVMLACLVAMDLAATVLAATTATAVAEEVATRSGASAV